MSKNEKQLLSCAGIALALYLFMFTNPNINIPAIVILFSSILYLFQTPIDKHLGHIK